MAHNKNMNNQNTNLTSIPLDGGTIRVVLHPELGISLVVECHNGGGANVTVSFPFPKSKTWSEELRRISTHLLDVAIKLDTCLQG